MTALDFTDTIIYIQNEYPVRSQTFVAAEVDTLTARGRRVAVISCHRPSIVGGESTPIIVLADLSRSRAMIAHFRMIYRHPGLYIRFIRAVLGRLTSSAPWWFFIPLLTMDHELTHASHIHTHFATRAAALGGVIAQAFKISRSVTTHAADIYVTNKHLTSQLHAAAVGTVTRFNQRYLREVGYKETHLVRCGVEGNAQEIADAERKLLAHATTRDSAAQIVVLSVGRLVEKKGHANLINAVAGLAVQGVPVRLVIVGDGPLRGALEAGALTQKVDLQIIPQLSNAAIRRLMSASDVFALACVASNTGDADGLPVAILEAAFEKCPIVAGDVTGVSEFVDETTGILVDGHDIASLTDALSSTISDKQLTATRVQHAHARVTSEFSLVNQVDLVEQLFATARIGLGIQGSRH